MDSCRIYGNGAAGVVAQQRGSLRLTKCEVHDNCEGILIQDTGTAHVEQCDVYSNRANGIFVGFDHRGSATIIENEVHDNISRGVYVANNNGNIVVRGNIEDRNHGLPPQIPTGLHPLSYVVSKKYLKRTKKNKTTIKKAEQDREPNNFLDTILKNEFEGIHEKVVEELNQSLKDCACCKVSPPIDNPFSVCKRCKGVSYCSRKCQKVHWQEHKRACKNKSVTYPTFLDNNVSV